MNSSITQFRSLISDTRQMSAVYDHFNTTSLDDLLRWQWTQAVSALDKYMHDVIKVGLTMTFNKNITPTRSFLNFSVPLSVLEDPSLLQNTFDQFVNKKLSYNSYQTPEKINEGLSLIWMEEHKWQTISTKLGLDKLYVTKKLNLIAQRRNQIVHQGDYPSSNLEKEIIKSIEVIEVIEFIEQIVEVIHKELQSNFSLRAI